MRVNLQNRIGTLLIEVGFEWRALLRRRRGTVHESLRPTVLVSATHNRRRCHDCGIRGPTACFQLGVSELNYHFTTSATRFTIAWAAVTTQKARRFAPASRYPPANTPPTNVEMKIDPAL